MPLRYGNDGEVFLEHGNKEFLKYDPYTNEIKNPRTPNSKHIFQVVHYKGSLVAFG